jgi:hypothetical protein
MIELLFAEKGASLSVQYEAYLRTEPKHTSTNHARIEHQPAASSLQRHFYLKEEMKPGEFTTPFNATVHSVEDILDPAQVVDRRWNFNQSSDPP